MAVLLRASSQEMAATLGRYYVQAIEAGRICASKLTINSDHLPVGNSKRWVFTMTPVADRGKYHFIYDETPECFNNLCVKAHVSALKSLKQIGHDVAKETEFPRPSLVTPHLYDDGNAVSPPKFNAVPTNADGQIDGFRCYDGILIPSKPYTEEQKKEADGVWIRSCIEWAFDRYDRFEIKKTRPNTGIPFSTLLRTTLKAQFFLIPKEEAKGVASSASTGAGANPAILPGSTVDKSQAVLPYMSAAPAVREPSHDWTYRATSEVPRYDPVMVNEMRKNPKAPMGRAPPGASIADAPTFMTVSGKKIPAKYQEIMPPAAEAKHKPRKLPANTSWQKTVARIGGVAATEIQFAGGSGVISTGSGTSRIDAVKLSRLPEFIRTPDAYSDGWGNSWADIGPKDIKDFFEVFRLHLGNLPTGFPIYVEDDAKRDPYMTKERCADERKRAASKPETFVEQQRLWYDPSGRLEGFKQEVWLEPATLDHMQSLLCHGDFTTDWIKLAEGLNSRNYNGYLNYDPIPQMCHFMTMIVRFAGNLPRNRYDITTSFSDQTQAMDHRPSSLRALD